MRLSRRVCAGVLHFPTVPVYTDQWSSQVAAGRHRSGDGKPQSPPGAGIMVRCLAYDRPAVQALAPNPRGISTKRNGKRGQMPKDACTATGLTATPPIMTEPI